jgi:phage-related minor tail protein
MSMFSLIYKGIKGTMGFVGNLISAPFKAAFRAVAWLWNNTVGKLSFKVPGWVPGIGGKGFDVPDIPMLAEGGIVTSAQLAMIGERGPEAVIPLSKLGSMGFGGGGGMNINVNAGLISTPDQIGQQIIEAILKAQRRSGQVFASA